MHEVNGVMVNDGHCYQWGEYLIFRLVGLPFRVARMTYVPGQGEPKFEISYIGAWHNLTDAINGAKFDYSQRAEKIERK